MQNSFLDITEDQRSSWCQICRHWWHRRLSSQRQPPVPPVTTNLASQWQHTPFLWHFNNSILFASGWLAWLSETDPISTFMSARCAEFRLGVRIISFPLSFARALPGGRGTFEGYFACISAPGLTSWARWKRKIRLVNFYFFKLN